MSDFVKEGWLQGGFAGLFVVLSMAGYVVSWIVIKTLWKDNKKKDEQMLTMAIAGRAVLEKQAEASLIRAEVERALLEQSSKRKGSQ